MVLLVRNRLLQYLFLPACLLIPSATSQTRPTLPFPLLVLSPKTVSLIDCGYIGVELTLLQGLTVNVIAPASATPGSNLPVVIVSSIFISAVAYDEICLVDLRRRFRNRRYQQVRNSSLLLEHWNICQC